MIYVTKLIILGKLKLVLRICNIKCGKIIKIIWKIQLLKINLTFDQRLVPCTIILYERYIILLHQLVEEGPIDQPSIRVARISQVGSMRSLLIIIKKRIRLLQKKSNVVSNLLLFMSRFLQSKFYIENMKRELKKAARPGNKLNYWKKNLSLKISWNHALSLFYFSYRFRNHVLAFLHKIMHYVGQKNHEKVRKNQFANTLFDLFFFEKFSDSYGCLAFKKWFLKEICYFTVMESGLIFRSFPVFSWDGFWPI